MTRNRPDHMERTRPIKARTKAVNTREGIVEAMPGVSGNLDLQADVIMPGAFTIGLREVPRPKMLFDHDWSKITGKSLEAEELMPKDPRLETVAPDLFEAGFGGLAVTYQLNLEKDLARDVMSDIVFFDEDGEWSIGYETLDAEFLQGDDGQPFRGIKALITWEGSFVLFGANRLTRTVGAKGVDGAGVKGRLEELDEAGRKLVVDTLSRTLGVKVTPGVYAVTGGKVIAVGGGGGGAGAGTSTTVVTGGAGEDKAAIRSHSTATADGEWDGPGAVSNAPNDAATLRYMHAWRDPDGDDDAKATYKFPHHAPGTDTAANLAAVRNGLARLSQADIPEGDRSGVEAHLRSHLEDAEDDGESSAEGAGGDGKQHVPGSLEERREWIYDAVRQWATAQFGQDTWPWVFATMPDRVIVEVNSDRDGTSWWSLPYIVDAEAGGVTLGDPTEVEVTSQVRPANQLDARTLVTRALTEDHGVQIKVRLLADVAPEAALPEGVVLYEAGGKTFRREWAADRDGAVALGGFDGKDGVLPASVQPIAAAIGDPPDSEGEPPEQPAEGEGLDDLDLMEFEQVRALTPDPAPDPTG